MRALCFLGLVAVGCGVDEVPSVAFSSPAAGTSFVRDSLGGTGALVASVPLTLDITGPVARVAVTSGQRDLGDATGGSLTAELRAAGTQTLTATALDDAGTALATATLDVTVTEPQAATCKDWLDLYRLDYSAGSATPGFDGPAD